MSARAFGIDRVSRFPRLTAVGVLAAATVACLLPWINKAFCIDDPLFLWAAAQIQAHPLDFYGCKVNWYSTVQPLYDVTKNPPLASYYLAVIAAVVGWSEPALHAAFFVPAAAAVGGTWFLARSLCRQPLTAALVALVTPAFLVSSSNVMCDTMMVALWTWAVGLWVEGLKPGSSRWLFLAALLIAAAALTKYFAMCLIPLLAVYTVVRYRRATWQLAWLAIPLAVLAGYQAATWKLYGRGLLSDAASFAWRIATVPGAGETISQETVGSKIVIGLCFAGGSFLPVLFYAAWLLPKRGLAAAALLGLATTVSARWFLSRRQLDALHMVNAFNSLSAVQLGVLATCGTIVLWLALYDAVRNPTAESWLLLLWVLGTFMFAAFVNWTCNVRSMLPIAPAFGILVMRRIEPGPRRLALDCRWALLPSLAVALVVTWADYRLANSGRTAAARLAEIVKPEPGTHWFEGHWGFQYYMQAQGCREVDLVDPKCLPGEVLITPYNNTDVFFYSTEFVTSLRQLDVPTCPWLSTFQGQVGAAFYSSIWGPMPFVFAPVPKEIYEVWRLKLNGDQTVFPGAGDK